MYLRKLISKNKFNVNLTKKNFSFMDQFNKASTAFRMTKYDPKKELEVNFTFKFTF